MTHRLAIFIGLILTMAIPPSLLAESAQRTLPTAVADGFTIWRFVLCTDVVAHEPVNPVRNFSRRDNEAFAFIEVHKIKAPTELTVIWTYQQQQVARVPLQVGVAPRWRTYSSKQIEDLPGRWRVELVNEHGAVLTATDFQVR